MKMFIKYVVLLFVTIYTVSSDDCVTYKFGDDFPKLFVDDLIGCTNHQWTRLQWLHEMYSNSTIAPPSGNSKWFITPPGAFSCASSFLFNMTPGGLLEVLTYREPTPGNSLSIIVHEHSTNRLVARTNVNDHGWHITTIPLSGTTDFVGYVTFTGTKTMNSVVIIDSFRYVPPSLNPEECVVYPDDNYYKTTTVPTTKVPAVTTTTDATTLNNDCVKYTFEEDFETLFANNTQCVNMFGVQTSWSRHEYSNTTKVPPKEQSKWFISPSSSYSCISSFNFTMTTDGLIEIQAYIDAKKDDDYLEVWVHKIGESNYNALVGHGFLHAVDHGWHIMSIYLSADTETPFEGFITFTGLSNPDSSVIVDSFRYVAPSLNTEECILYQEDVPTTTSIPILTTTDGTLTTTGIPTLTTTDTADSENLVEKIIKIKKIKTIRIETTVIKKVFRLKNE